MGKGAPSNIFACKKISRATQSSLRRLRKLVCAAHAGAIPTADRVGKIASKREACGNACSGRFCPPYEPPAANFSAVERLAGTISAVAVQCVWVERPAWPERGQQTPRPRAQPQQERSWPPPAFCSP